MRHIEAFLLWETCKSEKEKLRGKLGQIVFYFFQITKTSIKGEFLLYEALETSVYVISVVSRCEVIQFLKKKFDLCLLLIRVNI